MHLPRKLLGILMIFAVTDVVTANFSAPLFSLPAIAQGSSEQQEEADRLRKKGIEQYKISQFQAAVESWQKSLAIYQEIGDSLGMLKSLNNLGIGNASLGQYPEAIAFFEESLAIAQAIEDTSEQTYILHNLGGLYSLQNEYQQAIEVYQQSLKIFQETDNLSGEAASFNNLGIAYKSLGQYQKAIEFYQQSLKIFQDTDDYAQLAKALNNLGELHSLLGQYQKAIEFYQQSLVIFREKSDQSGVASSLNNLGIAYKFMGEYQKAIEFYQKSLVIFQEIDEQAEVAKVFNNLGEVYYLRGEYQQAVEFHQQSLAIKQDIGDRSGIASSFNNLGEVYSSLGEYQKAMEFYQQSLAISQEIEERSKEGTNLSNIALLLEAQNQPELAIIFYKQSVNIREAIRTDNKGLSKEQQQSYTDTVADDYRRLADLLLQGNRILEAQQVLDLLKVQELDDYLGNVRGSEDTAKGVVERPIERGIRQGTEEILNRAIALGKELSKLDSIKPVSSRSEAEKRRIREIRQLQGKILEEFQGFLKSPEVQEKIALLQQNTDGEDFDIETAKTLQDNLNDLQENAVILYPLVLDERLELILVTPDAPPLHHTVEVKREELNKTILQFRQALQTPFNNPKVPAQKLYNWLIKPLEADLAAAEAKTIIYAPDGQLRYIPLAALYDGKQWLTENFRVNNITALSLTEINTKPQPYLEILAAAFTKGKHTVKAGGKEHIFRGLQHAGVEVEKLTQLIPETTKLLDDQFNQETILDMNSYSVVHLATHAAFVVGEPEESFIVFGDGTHATLKDIETWSLPNVDLVVLSACETGLGDILGDGKEILGLGYQMQKTKARAVIASLWQVNDGGTQVLMNTFYGALQENNFTKAEALRQAQLALITGDYTALGEERGPVVKILLRDGVDPAVVNRLSHPYYWASFILIGNGL
ncbi:MAG: tetratricopeptide repeat protein [Spirulinaceae cyanobacterium]